MLFHSGYNVTSCQKPQPDFPTMANCNFELVSERNPFSLNCFCPYFVTGMNQVTKRVCVSSPGRQKQTDPEFTDSQPGQVSKLQVQPETMSQNQGGGAENRVLGYSVCQQVQGPEFSPQFHEGKKKRQNKTHKRTMQLVKKERKKMGSN